MNEKRYSEFMSKIRVSQTTVDKAVVAMYESGTQTQVISSKPKHRSYRRIAATAAVLCLVMLAGVICYPFGSKVGNVFIINAGAAEVNNYELTKLGELKCESNSLGLVFDEEDKVTSIVVGEMLEFPVTCMGEGIEKVTYELQGKGFFFLPEDSSQIYDKLYFEDNSVILPYVNTNMQWTVGANVYLEKVNSFTIDYTQQNADSVLYLYTSDDNGAYCEKYNDTFEEESDGTAHGKNFDYQQMYYDLFTSDEHLVKVTATFEDGTTQTKTLELYIEKADPQSYIENHSTLIVSAKLAE